MIEIQLTPAGSLRWLEEDFETRGAVRLRESFLAGWRHGLFALGAEKAELSGASPSVRYWQDLAGQFLTRLCHLPESMEPGMIEAPTETDLGRWVLSAPPMQGGEYLTPALLRSIWDNLLQWCDEEARAAGGLGPFLEARAPRWRQVGRVCFHLAENKNDPDNPFAFMATFVSGLGASGRTRHVPLGQALEQYAGANNRPALVKLLSPVHEAGERCDWVKEMAESGEIYRPSAWTAERAYRLLLAVPVLEESGLSVRLPDWWRRRPRPRVGVTIGSNKPAGLGAAAMLDFNVHVALGDDTLSDEELHALLNDSSGAGGLVLLKGQWVEVDRQRLGEAINHWNSLREDAGAEGISFIEGMRLLAGASQDLQHEKQSAREEPWMYVEAGKSLRRILDGLRSPESLDKPAAANPRLDAMLRPYQRHGVAWLHFLSELGLGACLADDMGLGKTIQVLAVLSRLRESSRVKDKKLPSLLVVPASLLANWRAEAERFAPELRLAFLHPAMADRASLKRIEQAPARELADTDLAVTTYAMLTRQEWLAEIEWRLVILDEAQAIKNPGTHQSRAVRKLRSRARVAMTGTPVENRLGDLWSLFDFLNPGLLGSARAFKTFTKSLEDRPSEQFAPLRRLVAPYILRRLKTDRSVISDLPEKVETTRFCTLTRTQVRMYEQIVKTLEKSLLEADGVARRGLVLATLMRLKQVCNHPSQLTGDGIYNPEDSGKFQRLAEICEELAERQERVLVFTQFREITDPLAATLSDLFNRPGLVLHGGTSVAKRRTLVEDFQRPDGPPFMVLSLKAGGTGLNLTAASHVVHFDRWWNPAVEDQATDRAFRIGQKKNVLVHKFVTSGTAEERIDQIIRDKKMVAGEILSGGDEVDLTSLNDEELISMVQLDIQRATL